MSTTNDNTVTFTRDKETPKKIRFTTDEDSEISGSIYLKKADAKQYVSVKATLELLNA